MAGIKALRKIQLGRETTAGTAILATTIWRGMGTIEDQREVVFAEEDVGYLGGLDRTYTPKLAAGITMEDTEATFEQVLHVFEGGIKSVGSGVVDTGGSGYVYTYPFATTSLNTIKSYTLEGGDNQQAEEMEYAFVQNFTLSGVGGEGLMVSSDWLGRQVVNTTFTSTATLPTVEEILFSKGKLYIDAADGTIGDTQVSSTLLDGGLTANTGIIPKFTADGSLYFTIPAYTRPEITLDLTYEHNASAVTEKTAWRDETARLVRLIFEGSTLTTTGTFTYKTLIVDLAGKYENFDALGDQDGNDVLACTFRARYNATAALFAEMKVVNELATVP